MRSKTRGRAVFSRSTWTSEENVSGCLRSHALMAGEKGENKEG